MLSACATAAERGAYKRAGSNVRRDDRSKGNRSVILERYTKPPAQPK
jgi:hypothetical protein